MTSNSMALEDMGFELKIRDMILDRSTTLEDIAERFGPERAQAFGEHWIESYGHHFDCVTMPWKCVQATCRLRAQMNQLLGRYVS